MYQCAPCFATSFTAENIRQVPVRHAVGARPRLRCYLTVVMGAAASLLCAQLPLHGQEPLIRYTFDDCSDVAEDIGAAPASNAILGPDATVTTNTPGGASACALDLRAPGANSYITAGDTPEAEGLSFFTLTTWLYLEGTNADQGGSGNVRLLAKQANNPNFDGISWNLNNPTEGVRGTDNFRTGLFVGGQDGFLFAQANEDTGADEQWTFLAVTYDGDSDVDNVRFYAGDEVNPVVELGLPGTAAAGPVASTTGIADFGIGFTDAAPGLDFAADGFQDDVRLYDRVLTLAELEIVRLENLAIDGFTCDFNSDSLCNGEDIDLLGKEIIAGTNNSGFDLTGDGLVNLADQDEWRSIAAERNGFAAPYLNGDADLDGSVLASDLNAVGRNWRGTPDPWSDGDFNADGTVDAGDLNLLGLNWQQSILPAAAGEAVPEPSGLALLMIAVFALVIRRR